MKLKKVNAVLALFSTLALMIHVGYNIFAYLVLYYNPFLATATIMPCVVLICAHAVCGMCAVFLQGDGTRLDVYGKQNRQLVIQRVTAALFFPLLILHIKAFDLEKASAGNQQWFLFVLMIIVEIIFYAVVFLHVATSFSKAFITLGILKDRKKQKTMDRIVTIVLIAVMILLVYAVVSGKLKMFVWGGV